jgi:hypothetical protein
MKLKITNAIEANSFSTATKLKLRTTIYHNITRDLPLGMTLLEEDDVLEHRCLLLGTRNLEGEGIHL